VGQSLPILLHYLGYVARAGRGVAFPPLEGELYIQRRKKPSRRIMVTSSLNEMSTDQQENRIVVRVGGVTPPAPTPFYGRLLNRY
jgi:hypothetical protein